MAGSGNPTENSAVRHAAELISAAEELFEIAVGDEATEVAAHIGTIADAAKALRAGHLADALAHVHYRAQRIEDIRASVREATYADDVAVDVTTHADPTRQTIEQGRPEH